jgi:hypothetical protein
MASPTLRRAGGGGTILSVVAQADAAWHAPEACAARSAMALAIAKAGGDLPENSRWVQCGCCEAWRAVDLGVFRRLRLGRTETGPSSMQLAVERMLKGDAQQRQGELDRWVRARPLHGLLTRLRAALEGQ